MNKNALTVLELIVVIVIIGITVAMGIPYYNNWIERTRTDRAIAVTELIASAYAQYYRVTHGTDPAPLPADLPLINTTFNLGLSDPNFGYEISWNAPLNTILRIVVTRNGTAQSIIYNLRSTDGTPEGFDHSTSTWHPEWLP